MYGLPTERTSDSIFVLSCNPWGGGSYISHISKKCGVDFRLSGICTKARQEKDPAPLCLLFKPVQGVFNVSCALKTFA